MSEEPHQETVLWPGRGYVCVSPRKIEKGSCEAMECVTIKPGTNCVFMKKTGCGFNGGACSPVVEACEGCGYVIEYDNGRYCQIYADPATKWVFGRCNFATHAKSAIQPSAQRLNPLKASKRSQRQGV